MDHHLDIHLNTQGEMGTNALMATLFYKVHVWIAHHAPRRIGLSFPDMRKTPGARLRVHGNQADLHAFAAGDWRKTLLMWVQQDAVQPVPANSLHCAVARVQRKSAHNMRQRAMRRHGLTPEQAWARIPDEANEIVDLPFLDLCSASTGQTLRFFIRQQTRLSAPVPGGFSAYGMGQSGATVPWF